MEVQDNRIEDINSTYFNNTAAVPAASGNIWRALLITLQSLILIFAVGGNMITLMTLFLYKQRRRKLTRMYLFILHLSVSDLMVALFNVTPMLLFMLKAPDPSVLHRSTAACKAVSYLSIVSIYASTYVLVMTAIDRFLAICFPFSAQRLGDRHVHIMVLVAWLLSFLFSIPQLIIFYFDADLNTCTAQWHDSYSLHRYYENIYIAWFASAVWLVPTAVIAICYISITAVVWNRGNALLSRGATTSNLNNGGNGPQSNRSRLLKPVQLTLAVIIGYIVCWTPWMVSMMVLQYSDPNSISSTLQILAELFSYLIGFNSGLNPLIYLCFNYKSFRRLSLRHRANNFTTNTQAGTETIALTQTVNVEKKPSIQEVPEDTPLI